MECGREIHEPHVSEPSSSDNHFETSREPVMYAATDHRIHAPSYSSGDVPNTRFGANKTIQRQPERAVLSSMCTNNRHSSMVVSIGKNWTAIHSRCAITSMRSLYLNSLIVLHAETCADCVTSRRPCFDPDTDSKAFARLQKV